MHAEKKQSPIVESLINLCREKKTLSKCENMHTKQSKERSFRRTVGQNATKVRQN